MALSEGRRTEDQLYGWCHLIPNTIYCLFQWRKGFLSDRVYLETISIILVLLSGLVFSTNTFENTSNVAICFYVEFFKINKDSSFLSSLLATDTRERIFSHDNCLAGVPCLQRTQNPGFPIILLSALAFVNLCVFPGVETAASLLCPSFQSSHTNSYVCTPWMLTGWVQSHWRYIRCHGRDPSCPFPEIPRRQKFSQWDPFFS